MEFRKKLKIKCMDGVKEWSLKIMCRVEVRKELRIEFRNRVLGWCLGMEFTVGV